MRGKDEVRGLLFSYVDLEQRIRADHPLRMIRALVNAALVDMSAEFDALSGEIRFHRSARVAFQQPARRLRRTLRPAPRRQGRTT